MLYLSNIFYQMEATGVLDPDDDNDLFVLHCVFLPRIYHSLNDFTRPWNVHPLLTERNWSPRKMWIYSNLKLDESETPQCVWMNTALLQMKITSDTVNVPEIAVPLQAEQLQESVDINTVFDYYGIGHHIYIHLRSLLHHMLHVQLLHSIVMT